MSMSDGWAYDTKGNRVYVGQPPPGSYITSPPYGYTWEKQTGGAFNIDERERSNFLSPAVAPEKSDRQRVQETFAESQPSAYYSSVIANLDRPQKDYFSYKFQDVYNEYLADLANKGTIIGGIPTGKFKDFLSKYDFYNNYMKQPYINRGGYQARTLAPPTRFLNY